MSEYNQVDLTYATNVAVSHLYPAPYQPSPEEWLTVKLALQAALPALMSALKDVGADEESS